MGIGDLSGKTAVVTGANRGIGAAIAVALARAGADIVGTSRQMNADEEDRNWKRRRSPCEPARQLRLPHNRPHRLTGDPEASAARRRKLQPCAPGQMYRERPFCAYDPSAARPRNVIALRPCSITMADAKRSLLQGGPSDGSQSFLLWPDRRVIRHEQNLDERPGQPAAAGAELWHCRLSPRDLGRSRRLIDRERTYAGPSLRGRCQTDGR